MDVREFDPADAAALAALFAAYMRETYGAPNAMTAAVLRRDAGRRFRVLLAINGGAGPVGFAAWASTYDLHHAMPGIEVSDLFVERQHRGRGVALRLIARLAQIASAEGATFIRGEVGEGARLRLVRRVTVGFPAETVYIAGRGLRQFAALAESDLRNMIRNLPTPDASRDP